MKNLQKLVSLTLALLMVFSLSITAFADEGTPAPTPATGNTITVNNAVAKQTYKLYKMLNLSVNDSKDAFSYTVNEAWKDFFKAADGDQPAGAGNAYVTIDSQGYVSWKDGASIADFAKAAEEYAKEVSATQTKTVAAEPTSSNLTFEALEPGYYLITSSLGTKSIVDTTPTNPNPAIAEKNAAPTVEKEVEEDSTPNTYGPTNDADIGDTVNYHSTITAQAGAENYILHDTMTAGLTFKEITGVTLKAKGSETETTVAASNYSVKTKTATNEADKCIDGCTFEIIFTQDFCSTLNPGDQIIVSYSAVVNEEAEIGLTGNKNESKVSYGDTANVAINVTTPSITVTYVWDLDILKYANGDESKVLKDAEFVLLNKDRTKVAIVKNGKLDKWDTVPTAEPEGNITWPDNSVLVTGEDGKISIDGLDKDTYYLREIKAPAGYNKLAEDKEIIITGATATSESDPTLKYETHIEKVNNNQGTELPETGGMGTTLFYVFGSTLVIAAVVLLVTKKRMSNH